MAKMKTHSGASKRFKKSKSGKIKAARAGHRHLLTKKNRKRKRSLKAAKFFTGGDLRRAQQLLPN